MIVFAASGEQDCQQQSRLVEEWVSQSVSQLVEMKVRADEDLRALFGGQYEIDEMSIMFTDEVWAMKWVGAAVRVPGVSLFNSAQDSVQTRPVPSSYDVHYWFLTAPPVPSGEPQAWRIEAMYPHSGSPLHDAALRHMSDSDTAVVHASFKCASEEDYAVAVSTLRQGGYEAAQLCDSTYGRFSYWLAGNHEDRAPAAYLKPRVNLRDQESAND